MPLGVQCRRCRLLRGRCLPNQPVPSRWHRFGLGDDCGGTTGRRGGQEREPPLPGWFHPDEPRAARSPGVIRDEGKPVLPVSSPCRARRGGAGWAGDGGGVVWVPGDLAGRAGADSQTLRDAQRCLSPPPCSPHPAQPRVQPGPGGLPSGWDAQSLFSALPVQRRLLQNPFISARSRHVWLSHGDGWGGKERSPEAEGQMKCLIRGGSC